MYFPYITGKAFVFRTLVELALILYAFLAIRDKSYLPKKSALLWAILGFTAILGLATIFSENPFRSFWSNYERMEGYVTVLHLLGYFVLLAGVFTRKTWYWFAHTSLAASIIIGLRGLADGQTRISGTLGNSTYLGVYAMLHIFIAGQFMLRTLFKKVFSEAWPWVTGYLVFIAFNAFILYRTGTRGSFLGLVAGTIVTALLLAIFERTNKVIRYTGISILALVVIVVGSLGLARNTQFVQQSQLLARFSSLITTDVGSVLKNQGYARSVIWSMAYNGFKERPVLGWGQDNFNYVFAKYYDPRMYNQEQWFDRSHNVFFDWLIAGGILGLLSYLSLFAALLYLLWRKQNPNVQEPWLFTEKAVLTGLLVAYFIHNLFVFDHLVSYLIFFALLAYVHNRSTTLATDSRNAGALIENEGTQYAVAGLIGVLLLGAMYVIVIKPYSVSASLIRALQAQVGGTDSRGNRIPADYKKALAEFKNVFSMKTFGSIEARERLSEVAGAAVAATTLDTDTKVGFVQLTQDEYKKQFAETGADPRPPLFYGLFLSRIGQTDAALVQIQRALELSPKKQSFIFQTALLHYQKGEFAKAVEYAKKGYEEEPAYNEALVIYAATLIYNNQSDIAEKEIEAAKARGVDVTTDERILQAYVEKKQFGRILSLVKKQVEADPKNPQLHVSLAAAYLKVNDRKNAIKEIQEAIKIEPAFKAQGESFIKEIQAGRDPSQAVPAK
jgi:O-antigen ligase/Tfp pilus assembly protein PilF